MGKYCDFTDYGYIDRDYRFVKMIGGASYNYTDGKLYENGKLIFDNGKYLER